MYKGLVSLGYWLPKYASRINTFRFLESVRDRKTFVPNFGDIQHLPCPNPPPRRILQELLIARIEDVAPSLEEESEREAWQSLTDFLCKYPVDVHWLMSVLSTYHAQCDIFDKGYVPQKRQS